MWYSYLKVALRLLVRNPFFAWINVVGLSVGFAVFIILWQYSVSELRSDSFYKDHERIYRLLNHAEQHLPGEVIKFTQGFDVPIHTVQLAERIPEVESFTRIYNQEGFGNTWISDHGNTLFFSLHDSRDEYFYEEHVAYADPNVFDFFGIPLVKGTSKRALDHSNSVVLSETIARKYFGDRDPIGKVISLNNKIPFEVSGVFKDLPKNTHLEFQIVLSMARLSGSINEFRLTNKGNPVSYFKIKEGANMAAVAAEFATDRENFDAQSTRIVGNKMVQVQTLQPLSEISFSHYWGDNFPLKSKTFLVILNAIAILILAVAWINYINLTLSANVKRSKELGARRTVGAKHLDFIKQFLLEAALINVLSIVLALTIIQLSKGLLAVFLNFHIYDTFDGSFRAGLIVLGVMLLGILVMGVYPAISSARITSRNLMSKGLGTQKQFGVVGMLSVMQYTCAIVLVITAFVIYYQIDYILGKDIGINRESIVVVDLPINQDEKYANSLRDFTSALASSTNGNSFTISNNVVGDRQENSVYVKMPNGNDGMVPDCNGGVDERFLPFYNIKLLAGRNFLPDHPADTTAVLVSLRLLPYLNIKKPEDIIGKTILVQEKEFMPKMINAEVIGVFADYKRNTFLTNDASMRKNDDSGIVLMYRDHMVPAQVARKISVKFASDDFQSSIAALGETFEKYFPGNVFHWYFLDENINNHYMNEKVARNQIVMFAALVICISCMGVFGMMMQRIIQKTKEIGVRKVLGARLSHIAAILMSTLTRHMLVGIAIGLPLAWYAVGNYLSRFSDKIHVQWWHYLLPIASMVGIILLAISYILVRASGANPVESLKHE